MSVDMKVKAIYDSEISNITRSEKNWKDVLKVAGQLYRYEFDKYRYGNSSEISRRKVPLWQIMTLGRKWEDM